MEISQAIDVKHGIITEKLFLQMSAFSLVWHSLKKINWDEQL